LATTTPAAFPDVVAAASVLPQWGKVSRLFALPNPNPNPSQKGCCFCVAAMGKGKPLSLPLPLPFALDCSRTCSAPAEAAVTNVAAAAPKM